MVKTGCVRIDSEGGVHGNDSRESAGISTLIEQDVAAVVGSEMDEIFAARYFLYSVPNPVRGESQHRASRP
jgi:hypothetical protein